MSTSLSAQTAVLEKSLNGGKTARIPDELKSVSLHVVRFNSLKDTEVTGGTITWGKLVEQLTKHREHKRKTGPKLWSLASYRPNVTRGSTGVESLSALVFDFDHTEPDWDRLKDYEYIAYTTWTHKANGPKCKRPDCPHWRVVIPLSRPVPADEWGIFWDAAMMALAPEADSQCKEPGRAYYLPAHAPGALPETRRNHPGQMLDPDEFLTASRTAAAPIHPDDTTTRRRDEKSADSTDAGQSGDSAGEIPANVREALDKLRGVKKTSKGWKALCPAHDDRDPSLSIGVGESGKLLLKCHAGCPYGAICAALGLTLVDSVLPFPLETLPDPLAQWVEQAAAATVVPRDYLAVPLLVAAGAAVGDQIEIELKVNWREGTNLYAAIVGDPGSRKTPAMNQAVAELYQIQHNLANMYEMAKRNFEEDFANWEARPKSQRGPKPKPPPFQHALTTDSTIEALATMLATGSILLHRDEIVGWVRSMDQYRSGRGSDRQFFLSAWSRQGIKVDRKGNPEPIIVRKPYLSVLGGVQTNLIGELADAAQREDGFVDRLLWAMPDPIPDAWTEDIVSAGTVIHLKQVFNWLAYRREQMVPTVVRLPEETKEVWRQFYAAHVAELKNDRLSERLRGPWAKMPAQVIRLALILHLLENACAGEDQRAKPTFQALATTSNDEFGDGSEDILVVREEELAVRTLEKAIKLGDYFKSHTRRVYRRLARDRRDLEIKILVALRERPKGLTASDIQHGVFNRNVSAEKIKAALQSLEEAGLVKWVIEERPRHPNTTVWRMA